jgi:hypothetical protein
MLATSTGVATCIDQDRHARITEAIGESAMKSSRFHQSPEVATSGDQAAGLIDGVRDQVMIAGFDGMRDRATKNPRPA